MRFLIALPALALLFSCNNGARTSRFCGSSFCLASVEENSVRQSSPVEDFTLYDVSYRNRHFRIYEGNNPRMPGAFVRRVATRLPSSDARLFRKDNQIEIYVDRQTASGPILIDSPAPSPEYLHIFTACRPAEECGIEDFASLIEPRLQHQ